MTFSIKKIEHSNYIKIIILQINYTKLNLTWCL